MTAAGADDQAHTGVTVASEVALAAVTLSVVLGLGRLFANGSFLPSLVAITVAAHLTAALVRRSRLAGAAAALVAVASGVLVVVWVRYGSTTFLGVPTLASFHHAGHDLSQAWHQFGQVVAPAPVIPGFVLAAAAAIWCTAWFADWTAFRLGAVVEATLPAAAIFLFASMLGANRFRVAASLAFVAAVLAFVLLHRADHQARASAWIGSGARDGAHSMVALGGGLLLVAVAVGAIVGPNLPGSRADPAVDWRGNHGQQATRITVSPLVDIRKRLVQQSNVIAFTVESSRRSYWRLTSLDSFDGTVWSSSGRFGRVNGALPTAAGPVTATRPIRQTYTITNLAQIWLPAAFAPTHLDPIHGTKVRWDAGSDTLIVDTGTATSDRLHYTLTSAQPDLTRAELDHAGAAVPKAIAQQYLPLPKSFPENVTRLAQQVTAAGQNPYQKALLLQDWFRTHFTYDLSDTQAGHSDQAIEAFIASRRGYCEQFAGTYAAMARAIGIPSRVAVGFTPGQSDPTDPSRYVVEGRYAHAWPEVWLAQAGWVPFEPTPGRGIPGAESYTGVADQQAGVGGATATTPTSVPVSTPATQPRPNPQATVPQHEVRTVSPTAPTGGHASGNPAIDLLWAVAAVALAGLVWVGGLAGVRILRRERRRRSAGTAAGRVEVAWIEGVEAVASVAPSRARAETKQEFAARRRPALGAAADPLEQLADLATAAQWSAVATAPDAARQAIELSRAIHVGVRNQISPTRRLRQAVLPRVGSRPEPRRQSSLWRKRSRKRWPEVPR